MKKLILGILLLSSLVSARADEGMWIPLLLGKYNIADMQRKGFKLTAEDIYSINKASMKDAVVIFGGGCTAEVISNEGLIVTNHHCGFSQIQSHSSVENDYISNGFWAMSKKEELTNQGLTVTFLVRMEDVSQKVLANVTTKMTEKARKKLIEANIESIQKKAIEGTTYSASIKPFFEGNEYYLFVTEVFKDVRLVGTPPSSIGKFGGDTDNWVYPRHTGDFSIFRIYANKNNQPADISPDNVPYKPKKSFPISLKGVKKNDFTMVLGYPGTTNEYLTSYGVEMIQKYQNPHRINIRRKKLDIIDQAMNSNDTLRIQYASKQATIANAWKKWEGENRGLRQLNTVEKKRQLEKEFTQWLKTDSSKNVLYGSLLNQYESTYKAILPTEFAINYFYEAAYSLDIVKIPLLLKPLLKRFTTEEEFIKAKETVKKSLTSFYKDYDLSTDKKIFQAMVELYLKNVEPKYQYSLLKTIKSDYEGDAKLFTEKFYNESVFLHKEKSFSYLDSLKMSDINLLYKDITFTFYNDIVDLYGQMKTPNDSLNEKLDSLNRVWIKALREMKSKTTFYPDANSTMRVAYGQVAGYQPSDAVEYDYYTTLDGVFEKENPEVYDYKVPFKLKKLYEKKDYGQYAENGKLHITFIASNHTTGGNSGSPVINGNGELIGINFDRVWEGTMSDIQYDISRCRNVSLDIRYVLFVIDKFAGASYLIKEMKLVH